MLASKVPLKLGKISPHLTIKHYLLGRCIGAIVSGFVSMEQPLESIRSVYRALGVVALLTAAIYLALYHLLLAPRCAAPAVAPPHHLLQGMFNGERS